MNYRWLPIMALSGVITIQCLAQTPLSEMFLHLRSSDPAVVQKAKDSSMDILMKELPKIERDTPAICNALQDSDSYIRLQAAAILTTIVVAYPSHNQVVLACAPELIKTARDPVNQIRNDSLYALALNPAGPPASAQGVFEQAMKSTNFRTIELGAAGLLKEDGGHNSANQELVANALRAAPDSNHKINLLYAIRGSRIKSDAIFDASRECLYDPNPDVQNAAVSAVAASGNDSAVINVMENFEDSSSINQQTRLHVKAVLNRIHAKQGK